MALNIITLVGSALSLFGLVITAFAHSVIRTIRKSVPSILLFNFCICNIIALVLFIIGTQATLSTSSCQAIAVLLELFWLATLAWMVAIGVNLHAVVVQVLGLNMDRRLTIYRITAWSEFILEGNEMHYDQIPLLFWTCLKMLMHSLSVYRSLSHTHTHIQVYLSLL